LVNVTPALRHRGRRSEEPPRPGAPAEFQKVLELPVVAMQAPYHALAHVGLARGRAKAGDVTGSRQAYEDFFRFWKDVDPDIPILQDAKRGYQKLAPGGRQHNFVTSVGLVRPSAGSGRTV